jgi:hypothetical protein
MSEKTEDRDISLQEETQIHNLIDAVRSSFVGSIQVYTNGSCYQFYKILRCVFPTARAYFNIDHVITKIGNKYYDITGEVEWNNSYLLMDEHYPICETKDNKFNIYTKSNSSYRWQTH